MLRRLLGHSRNNVVAYLALFVALGGTSAYAANTIATGDIIDNQVTSADVRDDNLGFGGLAAQDLGPGAVGSSEVQDDSLTGADVNESSLSLPRTTTTIVGRGNVTLDNNDGYTAIVTRQLPAGAYAIAATANISTDDITPPAAGSYETFCELRQNTGVFIGGSRDRRFRPGNANGVAVPSTISLSMNGAVQIPGGGGPVGVYCRYVDGTTFSRTIGDAQMMIIRLDGFF